MIVFLDSAPLSEATNPNLGDPDAAECAKWVRDLVIAGVTVCIPEIVDYELRRVLKRYDKKDGIRRLDDLRKIAQYVPLTQAAMSKASDLWALARINSIPTGNDDALDIDMILIAQAQSHQMPHGDVIIATVDSDIARFGIAAKQWREISIP